MSEEQIEKLVSQYKYEILNKALRISDNQTIRTFTFVEQLQATKLILSECYRIQLLRLPTNIIDLVISYCKLSDISGLASMVWLQKLVITNNQISNISDLSYLLNLTSLTVNTTNLVDIQYLKPLLNLKELELSENKIFDISVLQYLTGLQKLDMRRNQIVDVSALKFLKNLTNLNLNYNKITDISPILSLVRLSELQLGCSNVKSTSVFRKLTNLTILNLGYTDLVDIGSISSLVNLEYVNLEKNDIVFIEPLLNLKHIQELNLGWNNILDPKYYKKLHISEQCQLEPTNEQIKLGRKLMFIHKSVNILEQVTNKRITQIKKITDYKTKMNKLVHKLDKHLNKGWRKAGLLMERINIVDQSYLQLYYQTNKTNTNVTNYELNNYKKQIIVYTCNIVVQATMLEYVLRYFLSFIICAGVIRYLDYISLPFFKLFQSNTIMTMRSSSINQLTVNLLKKYFTLIIDRLKLQQNADCTAMAMLPQFNLFTRKFPKQLNSEKNAKYCMKETAPHKYHYVEYGHFPSQIIKRQQLISQMLQVNSYQKLCLKDHSYLQMITLKQKI
ncbi:leucine-rich_repeat domain-containing protein [Hexamita inflata]|uniref:Leucine-rich repeat domain-containing protein n=1 Tax=Hexamita inflata TaxID=28002 RepID=A0AA86RFN5_9EUKA|nr:leucine-rich repeat domain-containing protein [Hexamita inflata]